MKKKILILLVLMAAIQVQAAYYFVQTGKPGDAEWTTDSKWANGAGGTLVNLTSEDKTFSEWLTGAGLANGTDVWVAAGTYEFNGAATLAAGIKLYGSFAGTEKYTTHRKLTASGAAAWDWKTKTIFDANNACQFFSNNTNSTIDGITFQNGKSADNGGAFRTGNNSKVQFCRFISNSATVGTNGQGGAIQVYNAIVNITGCYFENNSGKQGGALYSNSTSAVTVDGCMFVGNSASNTGSAVHMQNTGAYTVQNCVFDGNTAKQALNVASTATATVVHNTFVNNASGALTITNGTVTNNVFWGTGAISAGRATLNYNAMVGSRKGDNAVLLSNDNSGSTDGVCYPWFTDPANHDYTLQAASTLIGLATASTGVTKDLAGTDRHGAPDMGAYEHTCEIPAPSYSLTIGAAGVSTLMLPFTVTELPAGMKVYSLQMDDSNTEIVATAQAQINADKPVYVVAPAGTYVLVGEGSANIGLNRNRHSFCDLEGSYYGYDAPAENGGKYNYVLQKQGESEPAFYQIEPGHTMTIPPYRAFLKTTYNSNLVGGARAPMRIRFMENATTSMEESGKNPLDLQSALRHGEVYDIMGRRVNTLQSGNIYLVDGVKILF